MTETYHLAWTLESSSGGTCCSWRMPHFRKVAAKACGARISRFFCANLWRLHTPIEYAGFWSRCSGGIPRFSEIVARDGRYEHSFVRAVSSQQGFSDRSAVTMDGYSSLAVLCRLLQDDAGRGKGLLHRGRTVRLGQDKNDKLKGSGRQLPQCKFVFC